MGRLFDAVGALCGVRTHVSYEGQAAIELEALAARAPGESGAYPLPLVPGGASAARSVLDAREAFRAIVADLERGAEVPAVAARFHNTVAMATAAACAAAARHHETDIVVLSGGVFQNRLLLERTGTVLAGAGLRTLTPERLPPNDGGIAYGQAAVAAATLAGVEGSATAGDARRP
jgi:hydrogenase maturation protein HypF